MAKRHDGGRKRKNRRRGEQRFKTAPPKRKRELSVGHGNTQHDLQATKGRPMSNLKKPTEVHLSRSIVAPDAKGKREKNEKQPIDPGSRRVRVRRGCKIQSNKLTRGKNQKERL